jgi:hypothetical protein
MARIAHRGLFRGLARDSATAKGVAVLAVVLFGFQVARDFLITPVNHFLCLQSLSEDEKGFVGGPMHHHDPDEMMSQPSTGPEDGFSLRHCKDTPFGIALAPMQPFGQARAAGVAPPQTAWAPRVPDAVPEAQVFLPTPFQPPRA